ncbi:MAG: GntR family transcriptional regulator [Betaproteobacteria bacterium]|nr:GntR family transcriptional regulator [Betaproteobacteria bacterium]
MSEPIPIRQVSVHEEVAARLRKMIFDSQLPPGAWVDEVALARTWQVSRTPLREALKVLVTEGLVRLVPRHGCQVVELTEDDARSLLPVMAMLEGRCAFEAVRRATPADVREIRRLHALLERAAAAGEVDAYYQANHVFHTTIQALSGNPWLIRVSEDLRKFVRLLRGRQLQLPGRLQASIGEHRELLQAIEQGDAALAERVMHDHLMAQLDALEALRALRPAAASSDATDTDTDTAAVGVGVAAA